jgi:ankyrin repeat protein
MKNIFGFVFICCPLLYQSPALAGAGFSIMAYAAATAAQEDPLNLLIAAHAGDVKKVNDLLSAGVNINYVHPLSKVGDAFKASQDLFSLLSSPDALFAGQAAIHVATKANQLGVLEIVIAKKANANLPTSDYTRRPALYFAKTLEAIKILVHGGADVNALDGGGITPLMDAVLQTSPMLVESFLNLKDKTDTRFLVDLDVQSRTGYSALGMAKAYLNKVSDKERTALQNIISLLERRGAKEIVPKLALSQE